jgi:hypothetical protein
MELFTATGTTPFTVPATVTHIAVELIGGGGGGGGSSAVTSGGDGGGGAYTKAFLSVTPGATYNVIVGGGGIGNAIADGSPGIASEFTDGTATILAFANPGSGGLSEGDGGGGGAGGTTTSNTALFASPGIPGPNSTNQTGTNGPIPNNGPQFVFNGIQYGAGGRGTWLATPTGQPGSAGAVLITY